MPAPTAPPLAPAPDRTLAPRVEHMNEWLAELSRQGAHSHIGGGLFGLLLGGVSIAGGMFVAFERDASNDLARGVSGGILIGVGTIYVTSAIYSFTAPPTTDELRYARWHALRSVDDPTLARFEGELAAEAAVGRQLRLRSGVESIGLAAGGAVLLTVTPLSRMHGDAAGVAYVVGAFDVAVGTLTAILSLAGESPNETAYRLYQEGKSPEHASNKLAVTPVLARTGAGIGIAGTF
jgi:hypothetical protein